MNEPPARLKGGQHACLASRICWPREPPSTSTGWDFSWFEGRATEERPPWGYARMLGERMSALAGVPDAAALDLQTGGGEVLATIPAGTAGAGRHRVLAAEHRGRRRNLARLGARVVPCDDELADLPFADADVRPCRQPAPGRACGGTRSPGC